MFFIKSAEKSVCPCCGNGLKVYGSRKRGSINAEGIKNILIIRRLKCEICQKIHHELPDILVPYKRYETTCIEVVITNKATCFVAVDESTINRWRKWFSDLGGYFLDSMIALQKQLDYKAHEHLTRPHGTVLEGIIHVLNQSEGWLAQVVRILVNTKMWVQTRTAFLSLRKKYKLLISQ